MKLHVLGQELLEKIAIALQANVIVRNCLKVNNVILANSPILLDMAVTFVKMVIGILIMFVVIKYWIKVEMIIMLK